MKKKMAKYYVLLGILGTLLAGMGTETKVEAAAYYGNGVYCNKQKCWVNWNRARSEIIDRGVKAYVNGFTKVVGGIGGR